MHATIPMLLVSTLAAAPQRASQEPARPQTGRPVDVSVEGLAARRTPDGTTNGGAIGLSTRRPSSGFTPLDCLASLADQATNGCLTASSTATLGVLFPYPGEGNVFAPPAFVGGGENNQAPGPWSTVTGGSYNTASGYDLYGALRGRATVGGGQANEASGDGSTVAGGGRNTAGYWSAVGGGQRNDASPALRGGLYYGDGFATVAGGGRNTASAFGATVGGGAFNTASGPCSTIGGGANNVAALSATPNIVGYATVGGGRNNHALAVGSTIGGGVNNVASGYYSTVPGGAGSFGGGDYSFAAGRHAKAIHDGAFVWGDSQDGDKASSGPDQISFFCRGGARFMTDAAATAGVRLLPGSSAWSITSDRASKENVEPVDGRSVLEKVVDLPIATWNYKAQEDSIRHMGPMAQDFRAAFGLGTSDELIDTIDPDGVALAAIQGLSELVAEKDRAIAANGAEIERLRAENRELRAAGEDLLARVGRLEALATGFRAR